MSEISTVNIRKFDEKFAPAWDNYVINSRSATFFHLSGWKRVLEKTFGYESRYLYIEDEGKICGILPLFIMKDLHFRKIISSVPFGVYGGTCADNEAATKLLLEEAKKIVNKEGAEYLELKNITRIDAGFNTKELYVRFVKELPTSKEECLAGYPRKARAACRKASDLGLTSEMGISLLKECYDIFAVSLRNLGSHVVPF